MMSNNDKIHNKIPSSTEVRKTLTPDWDRVGIPKPRAVLKKYTCDLERCYFTDGPKAHVMHEGPLKECITGSTYEGSWNTLGFSGYGEYTYPHGPRYQGNFRDGQFHGKGILIYPSGDKLIRGYWRNGKLKSYTFVFNDGLEKTEPFNYCQWPDRRFQTEFKTGFKGPGQELLTNKQPTAKIPPGCYDTIDGYFIPSVKCVFNYGSEDNKNKTVASRVDKLKRTVSMEESHRIEKQYRAAELDAVQYRPEFYETWMTGQKKELQEVLHE